MNLLLCLYAFISHHLEVLECEFLTFTFLKPFTFGDVFTPLFPEAIELTPTQDERIEMERPTLLFSKPVYVEKIKALLPLTRTIPPVLSEHEGVSVSRSRCSDKSSLSIALLNQ